MAACFQVGQCLLQKISKTLTKLPDVFVIKTFKQEYATKPIFFRPQKTAENQCRIEIKRKYDDEAKKCRFFRAPLILLHLQRHA